jgi:hypothetical protein
MTGAEERQRSQRAGTDRSIQPRFTGGIEFRLWWVKIW